MREEFWQGNRWSGVMWARFTCDRCKCIIDEVLSLSPLDDLTSRIFEGLNTGTHECTNCRKLRERDYDLWVTGPRGAV